MSRGRRDAPGGVRVGLADAWALRFESVPPVRRFASYRGQRHLSGCWWSATDGRHVGFESWLERDHVMALDFDPAVGAIASQPFWLLWPAAEGGGRYRSHAPDYFVRRVDGSAVVVDCRSGASPQATGCGGVRDDAAGVRAGRLGSIDCSAHRIRS